MQKNRTMKSKISILLLAILGITASCKGDKQTETAGEGAQETVNPNFIVEVNAYAAQKDDFGLYFTEDGTVNFIPEYVAWSGIDAKKEDAVAHFEIPDARIPTQIRLDLGLNKQQDSVVVKNVKLAYQKNTFDIKGSDFFTYFNRDEQFKTKVDSVKGTFTVYKSGAEYKTPFFYPNDVLANKIKELTGVAQPQAQGQPQQQ